MHFKSANDSPKFREEIKVQSPKFKPNQDETEEPQSPKFEQMEQRKEESPKFAETSTPKQRSYHSHSQHFDEELNSVDPTEPRDSPFIKIGDTSQKIDSPQFNATEDKQGGSSPKFQDQNYNENIIMNESPQFKARKTASVNDSPQFNQENEDSMRNPDYITDDALEHLKSEPPLFKKDENQPLRAESPKFKNVETPETKPESPKFSPVETSSLKQESPKFQQLDTKDTIHETSPVDQSFRHQMSAEQRDVLNDSPTFKVQEKKEEPEKVPEFGISMEPRPITESEKLPTFGFLQNFKDKPLFPVKSEEKEKPKKKPLAKKTLAVNQLPIDELNMSSNSANIFETEKHETRSANINKYGNTSPLSNVNRSFESGKNESPSANQKPIGFNDTKQSSANVSITLNFEPGVEPQGTNLFTKSPSQYSDNAKETSATGKQPLDTPKQDSQNNSKLSTPKSSVNNSITDIKEVEKPKPSLVINKGLAINKGFILPTKGSEKPALKLPPAKGQKMNDELDLAELLGNTMNKK
jgi:hypothetical protein